MDHDQQLLSQIQHLADAGSHAAGISAVEARLRSGIDVEKPGQAALKATLAGWLVDLGGESGQERPVRAGLEILEKERHRLAAGVDEVTYEYNLGNGRWALFGIERRRPGFQLKPDSLENLLRAKSHYWRAYKKLSGPSIGFREKLLVNLGNLLRVSGRIPEAVQMFDEAIQLVRDLPEAHVGRAEALIRLWEISHQHSVNLVEQAIKGYAAGQASGRTSLSEFCKRRAEHLAQVLSDLRPVTQDPGHDLAETDKEKATLSEYRRFCVDRHLALSEHSLYCSCLGSRNDNLTIPTARMPIDGEYVPRMEFILNRLKSEYALARLLYYRAVVADPAEWDLQGSELMLTQLDEGEWIGPRAEMLRTSFRICFGILDKTASAVCELFSLAERDESVRFESFWHPLQDKRDRWRRLNGIENLALLGLYCQATDLNPKNGDWPDFKEWRNALEHRFLIVITKEAGSKRDPYSVIRERRGDVVVPDEVFRERALLLLRMTRSALFNFVYCVRHEGWKDRNGEGQQVIFGAKPEIS